MATWSIKDTLVTVQSWLERSGLFAGGSSIGEPKAPKAAGFAAAVFMGPWHVAQLTLNNTVEVHEVQVRIYRNMLASPEEDIEPDLADAVDQLKEYLASNFKLDETDKVRCIDFGGQLGAGVAGRFGYITVAETMHRIADITLPIIVDDTAPLTP